LLTSKKEKTAKRHKCEAEQPSGDPLNHGWVRGALQEECVHATVIYQSVRPNKVLLPGFQLIDKLLLVCRFVEVLHDGDLFLAYLEYCEEVRS